MFVFRAVSGLNGVEFEGSSLRAEMMERGNRANRGRRAGPGGPGGPYAGMTGQGRQADFPLRVLVQSDMVNIFV